MTQLSKEVQEKMLGLKIGDYLQQESLDEFLSLLEGICDRKYANELISEVEKDVEAFAKNFELNLQREDSDYEEVEFATLYPETPEYLKKNAHMVFTPWDKDSQKKLTESLKNLEKFKKYLSVVNPDSEVNGSKFDDDELSRILHPDL